MKKTFLLVCLSGLNIIVWAQSPTKAKSQKPESPAVEETKFSPPVIVKDVTEEEFLDKNPEVENMVWKNHRIVQLRFKDKSIKSFDLSNEEIEKLFTEKYGTPPMPPPPPSPPPPPPSPEKKSTVKKDQNKTTQFSPPVIVKDAE